MISVKLFPDKDDFLFLVGFLISSTFEDQGDFFDPGALFSKIRQPFLNKDDFCLRGGVFKIWGQFSRFNIKVAFRRSKGQLFKLSLVLFQDLSNFLKIARAFNIKAMLFTDQDGFYQDIGNTFQDQDQHFDEPLLYFRLSSFLSFRRRFYEHVYFYLSRRHFFKTEANFSAFLHFSTATFNFFTI